MEMSECRFDHGACVVHMIRDSYGKPLSIRAFCSQAAAAMNEARALAEALVLSHEGHIARLEEEKEQVEEKHKGDIRYLRAQYDSVVLMKDQAEAREEALLKLLEKLEWLPLEGTTYCLICSYWSRDGHKPDCALLAALSPDAGRAKEVKQVD